MLPTDPTLPAIALLIASSVAATLSLFPGAVQAWSRRAFDRRPWLRTLTPDWDFAALTDVRSAWLLRVYGLVLVPVAALAAHALIEALKAA